MKKLSRAALAAAAMAVCGLAIPAPAQASSARTAPSKGVWTGMASYYNLKSMTAYGGRVGHRTAAHRSLPFGSKLRVTNLANKRSVVVTVNDRGPFVGGRIIDLSQGAAQAIGMVQTGVARVHVMRIASAR